MNSNKLPSRMPLTACALGLNLGALEITRSSRARARARLRLRAKAGARPPARRKLRGFLLIECVFYFGLLVLVLGLACEAFWRCVDNSKSLQRTDDDILRAVQAGERWRDDVRSAQSVALAEADAISIVQSNAVIQYSFAQHAVWRRTSPTRPPILLLSNVKASQMSRDSRPWASVAADPRRRSPSQITPQSSASVKAWRWDLELESHRKLPQVPPLFTFEAVPGGMARTEK